MNAVATPPVQPDLPANPSPAALHRDDAARGDAPQAGPSFMAALHEVKRDKALEQSNGNPADPPVADQPALFGIREVELDALTLGGHVPVPIESKAVVLADDGMSAMTGPALIGRISAGALEDPAPTYETAPENEAQLSPPLVRDLRGAVGAHQASGMPAAARQTPGQPSVSATVLQIPVAEVADRKPAMGADAPQSLKANTPPVVGQAPGTATATAIGNAAAGGSDAGKGPDPGKNAFAASEAKHHPSSFGPGHSRPILEAPEAFHPQSQGAVGQTASPVARLFGGSGPQANLTPSAAAPPPEIAFASGPAKETAATPDTNPSARLTVARVAAHDGSTQTGDGKHSEDHRRPWLAADQIIDAKPGERSLRRDADARSDWPTAVDRNGALPVGKTSPPLSVEKAPTPTADTFRSQNIDPIVERIAVSIRGNQTEARIALKPDHLGSIRLQIATDNSTVSIKILTEFPMARELLEAHLPQLKTDLQQQGLELDEFNITLNDEEQDFRRHDRRHPGTLRKPHGSGRRQAPSDPPRDDLAENPPAERRSPASGVDFFA